MSAPDGVSFPDGVAAPRSVAVPGGVATPGGVALPGGIAHIGLPRWSRYAWGAIAVTVAFIAITYWWLTQDHSIPIYDAGDHLEVAFLFHDMLRSGNLLGPFNYESPYPPLGAFVGAIATLVGGINVVAPITGENLVFVPLLALGCYQTGRLLFGARAGLLATIFVLGSPLLIAQLHVFMLDAPEAAVVAVSIWLLLACEDFSRVGFAALAGLAIGCGLLVKVQYPPFIAGIVLMALLRGGWRNRRGLLICAAIAIVLAAPWYLNHLSEFTTFARDAEPHAGVPVGDAPPTLSLANFAWYFWNILNSQFLVPLFALIVGGAIWMAATLFRHRREAFRPRLGRTASSAETSGEASIDPTDARALGARLEFFTGAVVAWLLITLTPSHDIRYGIPLIPYLAVIATGWIVYLPRTARLAATTVVVLGVIANTLGVTFGVGENARIALAHPLPMGEEFADSVTFYTDEGFLVGSPHRDGDVPGLLEAMRRGGVRTVTWGLEQSTLPDFSFEGLLPLSRIADLAPAITRKPEFSRSARVATLVHMPITARIPPPCTRLSDGTGVWVVRYDSAAPSLALYCPTRRPQFYQVKAAR